MIGKESRGEEKRSQDFQPDLLHGWQGPKYLNHHLLSPKCISREPDQK